MKTLPSLPFFAEENEAAEESSSSDSDDEKLENRRPELTAPVNFRCFRKTRKAENDDFFVLDTSGTGTTDFNNVKTSDLAAKKSEKRKNKQRNTKPDDSSVLDEATKKLLSKSIIKPGFEKHLGEAHVPISWRAMKRQRKMERERTKGEDWYYLPAAEMTEERERDLEILQMRGALDPKKHYRRNDRSVLPKYFQVGTVIETKADFYSSRIPKKARKRTIVEELLADMDFQTRQRKKYQEIKAREAITKRGAFRRSSYPKRNRKFKQNTEI